MYDTSDIRKGLKIMMDGAPYTVVEFQFVKPGKGAAFTRTKMKNLLTGAVLERNFRSGEKLEPANVETKTMQYLYKEADTFVFMDTTTYDQVNIPDDHDRRLDGLHAREHQRRGAVLQRPRRRRDAAELHRAGHRRDRARLQGRHRDRRRPSRARSRPARQINVPLFISVGDIVKIDTRTGEYIERVGRA